MKIFVTILIIIGGLGVIMAAAMFGDIGIAAGICAITALVTGFGFLKINKLLYQKAI